MCSWNRIVSIAIVHFAPAHHDGQWCTKECSDQGMQWPQGSPCIRAHTVTPNYKAMNHTWTVVLSTNSSSSTLCLINLASEMQHHHMTIFKKGICQYCTELRSMQGTLFMHSQYTHLVNPQHEDRLSTPTLTQSCSCSHVTKGISVCSLCTAITKVGEIKLSVITRNGHF